MSWQRLVYSFSGLGLFALAACSGQAITSPASGGEGGGSGATGGVGGDGGSGGSACPDDLEVRTGPTCQTLVAECTTDLCVHAYGAWVCATPCPCADRWTCAWLGEGNGCVPESLAGCVDPPDGGSGGVGGSGGTGFGGSGGTGFGGSGGMGGVGGTSAGGMGGAGGTGPCNGDPACFGDEASFCSTDGMRLLSCQPGDECPAVTECAAFCSKCACHMAPPVNGVLRGTCDTCTSDADCPVGMTCIEHPMFPNSGAKTCVAP